MTIFDFTWALTMMYLTDLTFPENYNVLVLQRIRFVAFCFYSQWIFFTFIIHWRKAEQRTVICVYFFLKGYIKQGCLFWGKFLQNISNIFWKPRKLKRQRSLTAEAVSIDYEYDSIWQKSWVHMIKGWAEKIIDFEIYQHVPIVISYS